jgi:hypothetical protein
MPIIEELHQKYRHIIYGPDNLLKPLARLQHDLEKSGLPREERIRALRLAALYWADLTNTTATLVRQPDQDGAQPEDTDYQADTRTTSCAATGRAAMGDTKQEVFHDRRSRPPAAAR